MLNLGHLILIIVYSGFSRIPDSIPYSASAITKIATKHKYNYRISYFYTGKYCVWIKIWVNSYQVYQSYIENDENDQRTFLFSCMCV